MDLSFSGGMTNPFLDFVILWGNDKFFWVFRPRRSDFFSNSFFRIFRWDFCFDGALESRAGSASTRFPRDAYHVRAFLRCDLLALILHSSRLSDLDIVADRLFRAWADGEDAQLRRVFGDTHYLCAL